MPSVTRRGRSPEKGRPRQHEIEQRLRVATERMLADGASFTELSVERLATAAGISRSTFYVYFQDKGHLVRSFTEELMTELYEAASAWWELGPGTTAEELVEAMDRLLAIYSGHAPLMRTIVETASYDPAVRERYDALMDRFVSGLKDFIERGQAEGKVRQVPAAETAAVLSWMCERACHQLVAGASPKAQQGVRDALVAVVWHTLYPDVRGRGR